MESQESSLNIETYGKVVKKHWLAGLSTFLAVTILGVIFTALKPNSYEAEAKLKFKKSNASSVVSDLSRELGELEGVGAKSSPVNTEAEVFRSNPLIQKTINDLNLVDEDGNSIGTEVFREGLAVQEVATTDILRVAYRNADPREASEVVNTLIANYLNSNVGANRAEAVKTKKFLESQLPQAQDDLKAKETALKQFKVRNQIVSSEGETSKIAFSLRSIRERLREVRSNIAQTESRANYIKSQLNVNVSQAVSRTNIGQSPEVDRISSELQDLRIQLNRERSRFTSQNPVILDLQERIQLQEQLLAQQIRKVSGSTSQSNRNNRRFSPIQQELTAELVGLEADKTGLDKQLAYLLNAEKDLQNKASKLPELELNLASLQRDLDNSKQTYDLLQNRLGAIKVASNQDIGNVRIISYATVPEKPVSSRMFGVVSAMTLGLISAMGVIYLLETKNRSLKTVEEARKLFGYSWLGIIPSFDQYQAPALVESSRDLSIPPLVVKDFPGSSVSESFRMLQSNLRFLNSNQQSQTIVVTSPISGEGKSTVAANLATAMAQVGHKVLLVDADLHSPVQQSIWNTYSDYGLSHLLAENLDSRLAIESVMKNLSILNAGALPPSPATLLDSYRMKDLIYYWSRVYDYIIIDSPALETAADAPILGRMADGVLLVVKPESVTHDQATFAKETLERSGQNVLGIVFNDVDPEFDSSAHHYHPLEGKQQKVLPESTSVNEIEEGLWATIQRISQDSESPQYLLNPATDDEQIQSIPNNQLEETISYLQKDLEELTELVKEEEDELFRKRQVVRKLQRKINLASFEERSSLEKELDQEQEFKNMLDETLVGQRRNLNKKREVLRKYQYAFEARQN